MFQSEQGMGMILKVYFTINVIGVFAWPGEGHRLDGRILMSGWFLLCLLQLSEHTLGRLETLD